MWQPFETGILKHKYIPLHGIYTVSYNETSSTPSISSSSLES